MADPRLAARAAFAGSALFVALIVAFSSLGDTQPSTAMLLFMGIVGAASHLVLLPVVAESPAPNWARAGGYAWIAIDVMLNVATLNGANAVLVAQLRLGGHVPAALWIAMASASATGATRAVGLVLATLLTVHAFTNFLAPAWLIFIPFLLIPIWLALAGLTLRRRTPD